MGGGGIRFIVSLFSGLLVGAMSCVLAISFTAIVYTGPLEVFLDRGIGLSLIAAALMAATGALMFSYRATIMHTQDITAILLASGAAAIAAGAGDMAPDAVFATVVLLLVVASAVTGLAMYTLGKFELSYIVKFIPYPVLGGFLAATGYLLLIGAVGLVLRRNVEFTDLLSLLTSDQLKIWLPWVAIAGAVALANRLISNSFVLPVCIAAICAGFYAFLFATGMSLAEAQAAGFFIGPFASGGMLNDVRPGDIFSADLALVAEQSLTILAVMAMAILAGALNLSGIQLETKENMNLDRDVRTIGVASLVAAPAGGLVGFPALSNSLLAHRLGLRGAVAGLSATAVCTLVAVFGASALEYVPRGLFAAVIGYLGIDLLYTWIWRERRRLLGRDYLVILLIVLTSAIFGFLPALALGLLASILLFVVSYAKQGIVRMQTDLSLRRSTVERDLVALDHLNTHGETTAIIELTGYIFFGTANRLQLGVETTLAEANPNLRNLLIDFTRVQGIDPSAVHSLQQVAALCREKGTKLLVSSLSSEDREKIVRFANGDDFSQNMFASLDEALQHLEDQTLGEQGFGDNQTSHGDFVEALLQENPDFNLIERFPSETVAAGDTFLREGDASNELLILLSGSAKVFVNLQDGTRISVAHLQAGSLVGEIGYFSGTERTADVEALEDAQVLRISRDALNTMLSTDPAFVASFHQLATRYLSRRLERTTKLLSVALR